MRSLAMLALAAVLATGAGLLAVGGPAVAQDDDGDEVSFSSTCQQLRCFFELTSVPQAMQGNVTEVEWTFGPNGTTKTGDPVEHAFPEAGTFDVSVTVEGGPDANDTRRANASSQVTVSGGEVPWSAVGFGAVALVGSVLLARAT